MSMKRENLNDDCQEQGKIIYIVPFVLDKTFKLAEK